VLPDHADLCDTWDPFIRTRVSLKSADDTLLSNEGWLRFMRDAKLARSDDQRSWGIAQ